MKESALGKLKKKFSKQLKGLLEWHLLKFYYF
jgi:hypothetical protein